MTNKAKGISIRFLNYFLVLVTIGVFSCVLLISYNVHSRFKMVRSAFERFMVCQDSSKLVKESANYLTEQARLFVVTHNTNYAEAYLKEKNITKGRQRAMEQLQRVCTSDDLAYQRLQIAQNHSENLISIEVYALKLVYEGCKDSIKYIPDDIKNIKLREADLKLSQKELCNRAVDTLFGDGYLIYKKRVDENCNLTVEGIEEEITNEVKSNSDALGERLQNLRELLSVLLAMNLLTFISYHLLVLRPLKKY
ncbi:MAG: hypothetical protein KBT11_03070 [Treponema sp.]|nr:hypothetical protein [Candidatus Treponema equifaecale]